MAALDGLLREAFIVCTVLVLPAILVAMLVGTAIAVLQAATQVHEQTLTLAPKLLAVGVLVAIFGSFGVRLCANLFAAAVTAIPGLVAGN